MVKSTSRHLFYYRELDQALFPNPNPQMGPTPNPQMGANGPDH